MGAQPAAKCNPSSHMLEAGEVTTDPPKRNLPLCAQVSPASSHPGNGGDYLLCISQRAAGSEALGLSSAPSRNRQWAPSAKGWRRNGSQACKRLILAFSPPPPPSSVPSSAPGLRPVGPAQQERTHISKISTHEALRETNGCLQATQRGSKSSPWFSPVPTHLSEIKSRETGSQTVAVEGDAATALKQRLPRGAEHRGAGDPDRAAISQCSSPTPKREAHPAATALRLHQAGPPRSSRPPPSCCQPTQGTRTGAAPSLLHTTSLTLRLPLRTRGLPTIGYFLRALFLRKATNTEPRLCHAAKAPSPVLTLA
ncbi:uncharacterized protein LOC123465213 [Bubalus bubalis]|uniref:uncharacterized protein LOC123465213 n=1 Tax=Bubalus bubalis TaxID=89462 RepID=UPI001E1B7002|nr:uncharacterized protein LOC123465213 [Bubalus bubalis]